MAAYYSLKEHQMEINSFTSSNNGAQTVSHTSVSNSIKNFNNDQLSSLRLLEASEEKKTAPSSDKTFLQKAGEILCYPFVKIGELLKAMTGTELDVSKLLAGIDGASYVRRASLVVQELSSQRGKVYTIKNLLDAKKSVENAFKVQALGGFAFVELLGTCSINWKLPILDAKRYVDEHIVKKFPLGVYKDTFGVEKR